MTSGAVDFELDRFQVEATEAFDAGESVLVAAPTGSGKTVIAEHGIRRMLDAGRSVIYTSPIKALANQKFRDFGEQFGRERVGLLTGDVTVNGDAPVVVMTTEVLRNMLYDGAHRLRSLGCVVLDEVHYLQDRDRGPVWEEVLLNLPPDVRTISLSATVSNLDEFVAWLESVRGPTTLVVEHERPVPLRHHIAAADRESRRLHVEELLDGAKISREAQRFRESRTSSHRDRRSRGRGKRPSRPPRKWAPPRRTALTRELDRRGLAPLIWFIFSRAGCDEAVDQLLRSGVRFTNDDEADRLHEILLDRTADIDDETWYSLELDRWQDAFERGITSHHAGLVPAVKEAVEVAFAEGLITVVFATETLALGVNLPARTVVLERMVKYDGEDHKPLTPMEFTQLTGRAGRRGLDHEGTAICCWNPRMGVDDIATLAASSDYPLRSAFAPNYNMVANLIRRADQASARRFVARSFAQFQVDRRAVHDDSRTVGLERQLAEAERSVTFDRADVEARARSRAGSAMADDDELGALRPGSVVAFRGGAVVVSVAHRGDGVVVRLVNARGERVTVRSGEVPSPVAVQGVASLPAGLGPNDEATVTWAVDELQANWQVDDTHADAERELERNLAALREIDLLRDRLDRERRRSDRRRGRLEHRFDAVAEILHDEGFADAWKLTPRGVLLTQVHGEAEFLLADGLADGTFDRLDPPAFACAMSALVYEARRGDPMRFRWPNRALRQVVAELQRRADRLNGIERDRLGETLTRRPDPAMIGVVHGWATGETFESLLPESMTGGDFVRSMRQVIDVCRQVAQSDATVADVAGEAIFCLDHGVVRTRRDLFLDEDPDDADPQG